MIVYTSIVGGKDNLIHDQYKGDAEYFAFTDFDFKSDVWTRKPAYDKMISPRRNSRAPKILAHQFAKTRYSIWLDGNLKLLVPPEELLKYVENHDIALFKHPTRDCLYEEAQTCIDAKLDDVETLKAQIQRYRDEGFGEHRGLCEGGVIIRKHTPKVENFNNIWWSEHCSGSVRDQVSMFYAFDRAGLVPNIIDEHYKVDGQRVTRGGLFEYVNHLTPRPE